MKGGRGEVWSEAMSAAKLKTMLRGGCRFEVGDLKYCVTTRHAELGGVWKVDWVEEKHVEALRKISERH